MSEYEENSVFGRKLLWLSQKKFKRWDFSFFEDFIYNKIYNAVYHEEKDYEYQLSKLLKEFFCHIINNSYFDGKTPDTIRLFDIKEFLDEDNYRIHKFFHNSKVSCCDSDLGSFYRLLDHFDLGELKVLVPYIDKEILPSNSCEIPFLEVLFHCCRSDTFVNSVSQNIVSEVFSTKLDCNYFKGQPHPFWEVWDIVDLNGGTPIRFNNVKLLAGFIFIWYRLSHFLDKKDSQYRKYLDLVQEAEQHLLNSQFGDGSWSWEGVETGMRDVFTTCMAIHALAFSAKADSKAALKTAGIWLKKQWLENDNCFGNRPAVDVLCIDSLALCFNKPELLSFSRSPVSNIEEKTENKTKDITPISIPNNIQGSDTKFMNTKIFISHKSEDVDAAEAVVDFLEDLGVPSESIVCTTVPDHLIPNGENVYDWLRDQFINFNLHVILLLSKEYYGSAPCLNEMGAAWVTQSKCDIILLPGFSPDDVKGCISGRIAMHWDGGINILRSRLNELRDTVCQEFKLELPKENRWKKKRKELIDNVKNAGSDDQETEDD